MRERVKQFEKDWRVKHTGTVEVPHAIPDGSRQDACSSVDQADEMNVSTEAYENAKGGDQALTGDTTAEERTVESPSKRRKQEGDPDLRTPVGLSLRRVKRRRQRACGEEKVRAVV